MLNSILKHPDVFLKNVGASPETFLKPILSQYSKLSKLFIHKMASDNELFDKFFKKFGKEKLAKIFATAVTHKEAARSYFTVYQKKESRFRKKLEEQGASILALTILLHADLAEGFAYSFLEDPENAAGAPDGIYYDNPFDIAEEALPFALLHEKVAKYFIGKANAENGNFDEHEELAPIALFNPAAALKFAKMLSGHNGEDILNEYSDSDELSITLLHKDAAVEIMKSIIKNPDSIKDLREQFPLALLHPNVAELFIRNIHIFGELKDINRLVPSALLHKGASLAFIDIATEQPNICGKYTPIFINIAKFIVKKYSGEQSSSQ